MSSRILIGAVAAATLAVVSVAQAENQGTVLTGLQAPVMVNQGDSYRAATEGMTLSAGDRVMAMNGGSAAIAYPNGCTAAIGSNELVRVDTGEACATSSADAGTYQQAGGSGGGAGGAGGGSGVLTELAIVGGALLGGVAVIEATEDDDDDASR